MTTETANLVAKATMQDFDKAERDFKAYSEAAHRSEAASLKLAETIDRLDKTVQGLSPKKQQLTKAQKEAAKAAKEEAKRQREVNQAHAEAIKENNRRAREHKAATDDIVSSSRRTGQAAQNASFQVADFFVQVEAGTPILRAATQQLPQFLGAFGAVGAGAGAVIAISGAIASLGKEIFFTANAAEGLLEEIDALNESYATMDARQKRVKENNLVELIEKEEKSLKEYNEQLKEREKILKAGTVGVGRDFGDLAPEILEKQKKKLDEINGAIATSEQKIDRYNQELGELRGELDGVAEAMGRETEELERQFKAREKAQKANSSMTESAERLRDSLSFQVDTLGMSSEAAQEYAISLQLAELSSRFHAASTAEEKQALSATISALREAKTAAEELALARENANADRAAKLINQEESRIIQQRNAEQRRIEIEEEQQQRRQERARNWFKSDLELLKAANDERIAEIRRAGFDEIEQKKLIKESEKLLDEQEAKAKMDTLAGSFDQIAGLMSSENKKLFRIGQAAALATATVNFATGMTEAMKLSYPLNYIDAAARSVAFGIQLANIRNAKPPGRSQGGEFYPGQRLTVGEFGPEEIQMRGFGRVNTMQQAGGSSPNIKVTFVDQSNGTGRREISQTQTVQNGNNTELVAIIRNVVSSDIVNRNSDIARSQEMANARRRA